MKASNTRKHIKIYAFAAAVILLAATAAVIFAEKFHPEVFFYVQEWWYDMTTSVKLTQTPADECGGRTYASVDEILADTYLTGKVTVNESLILVNAEYVLPENFAPEIGEYKSSGVTMNTCIIESYGELTAAVTEAVRDKMYISSSYRTAEKQAEVYDEDPSVAAHPGESEHQTGLALDVYVQNHGGYAFIKSAAGQFVARHAWEYGFIVRYPMGKTDITGITYEPWHIRYVGAPHAEIIRKNSLTLEEYIAGLKVGTVYGLGEYTIIRCEADALLVPDDAESIVISADNTGKYIITVRKGGGDNGTAQQ